MALVSYGSSDNSDLEEDHITNITKIASKDNVISSTSVPILEEQSSSIDFVDNVIAPNECGLKSNNLFKTLPKPLSSIITEEDDEYLHKKENTTKKEKTKITIPSLSEFKDIDDNLVIRKIRQANNKKSGLLSILPDPKFSRNSNKKPSKPLIPNVVERKTNNLSQYNATMNKVNTTKPVQAMLNKKNPSVTADNSDSDEDDNKNSFTGQDFFSIYSSQAVSESIATELSEDQNNYNNSDHTINRKSSNESIVNNVYLAKTESSYVNVVPDISLQESASVGIRTSESLETSTRHSNELQLDDEAIRQLCGARKRHRKEDIQVITIDQQQVLSDSREWLVKGLMDDTSKRVSCSKKGNEPTSQQKRKHHITYLAHQAKANEAELQNQWSNNRMSKRQTQSKYGF